MLAAERRLGHVLGALLGGGSLCVSLLHMSGAGAARRAKPAGLTAAEAKAPREALTEPGYAEAWPYSAEDLRRRDESSDADFYSQPRLVTHIDDAAIESLRSFCAPPDPRHHPRRPPRPANVNAVWWRQTRRSRCLRSPPRLRCWTWPRAGSATTLSSSTAARAASPCSA